MSSELLAVLSNPRRRRKKGARKAARQHRRAARHVMASVVSSRGTHVSRARFHHGGFRRNPIRRRRYRHNPRGVSIQALGQDLVGAAAGAAGGVAVDLLMRPLPLALKAGPLNYLVRGAASIGLGIIGGLARLPYAGEIGRGAMSITLYNAARQYVLLPRGLGELSDEDIAALSEGSELNPAPVVGEYLMEPLPAPLNAPKSGMGEYTLGEGVPDLDGNYVED